MFRNIAFVGGIHGVGKSTICKKICCNLNLTYLSASELLQWRSIKHNYKDKKVENLLYTQSQLIKGLKNIVEEDKCYLLDGHFCLWDIANGISRIPKEIFLEINPSCICVITDEVSDIKLRLEMRDNLLYSTTMLKKMQQYEVKHAKSVAKYINAPFFLGIQDDFLYIEEHIKLTLNK